MAKQPKGRGYPRGKKRRDSRGKENECFQRQTFFQFKGLKTRVPGQDQPPGHGPRRARRGKRITKEENNPLNENVGLGHEWRGNRLTRKLTSKGKASAWSKNIQAVITPKGHCQQNRSSGPRNEMEVLQGKATGQRKRGDSGNIVCLVPKRIKAATAAAVNRLLSQRRG